jgi:hypothetical protein
LMNMQQKDPQERITDLLVAQIVPGIMTQVRKNVAGLVNELWQEKDSEWKEMVAQKILQPREALADELTDIITQQIVANAQGGHK